MDVPRPTLIEDAAAIRAKLADKRGPSLWRSVEELVDAPEFQRLLAAEFPALAHRAEDWARRDILKLLGASLALAGLAGCSAEPAEHALPYVEAPEFVTPGKAKYYATAALLGGYAQPILGETQVGRPTKLEGNPDHPACLGATDAFTQAALLGLYDPDRSRTPRYLARPTTWSRLDAFLVTHAAHADADQGAGFRLLTGVTTSPTLIRQITAMLRRWPQARWHVHEPVNEDTRLEAARLVFGRRLEQRLRLDRADVIVSLDDDVLGPGPKQTLHARLWSKRRRMFQEGQGECRLFVAESTPSITGTMAQERAIVAPRRIGPVTAALAQAFGVSTPGSPALTESERTWLDAAVRALGSTRGRSIVTVGAYHSAPTQALALLINERLGNFGGALTFTDPLATQPADESGSLEVLADDIKSGTVRVLAVLDCNPAYTAPGDLDFAELMERVETRIHAGLYHDETAARCQWHAPLQHPLESWSDARAVDGLVTILQPLVRPFFGGRSRHEVVAGLAGQPSRDDRTLVRETWQAAWSERLDERWADALVRGFVTGSEAPDVAPTVAGGSPPAPPWPQPTDGLTVLFRPDPSVWDGRFANIAWLQELPKPLTKVTWDNVILVSPALAKERGIATQDEVRLSIGERSVVGPAWVMPGQEEKTITVYLGYGRSAPGRVLEGLGYDAYRLRTAAEPWVREGAALAATGRRWPLASTQTHFALDGHDMVRRVPRSGPGSTATLKPKRAAPRETLYPVQEYTSPSWGMSIDTDLCIGCNACVVACVAENNIPMVGKEQVAKGREMLWLRVDRYYEGDLADPKATFQPVPCMHCEQAPCEMGCPVNATTHSPDGLNQQIYNRCIGTRTCSSFCPYKVRRFNWFDFTSNDPPEMQALRNPNVTVRARGVMEKCTYCVQRIRAAEIAAKIEGRSIRDGEVTTACQQACPTSAIVFGDVKDAGTAVSHRKSSPRDYSLLEEVNTWPRTTYLARIDEPAATKDHDRE